MAHRSSVLSSSTKQAIADGDATVVLNGWSKKPDLLAVATQPHVESLKTAARSLAGSRCWDEQDRKRQDRRAHGSACAFLTPHSTNRRGGVLPAGVKASKRETYLTLLLPANGGPGRWSWKGHGHGWGQNNRWGLSCHHADERTDVPCMQHSSSSSSRAAAAGAVLDVYLTTHIRADKPSTYMRVVRRPDNSRHRAGAGRYRTQQGHLDPPIWVRRPTRRRDARCQWWSKESQQQHRTEAR